MVEIINTISTALSITSRLKEISENISDAEFKNLLADLRLKLANAKLKIAEVVAENAKLKERVIDLESAYGEKCPKCGKRSFELVSSGKHPTFGDLGVMERQYKCASFGFEEAKTVET